METPPTELLLPIADDSTPPELDFNHTPQQLPTFQEYLGSLIERQANIKERSRSSEFATIDIKTDAPIGLVLSSDWHIGAKGTDYGLFQRHMQMIQEEPNAYLAALSNTIDGYIWSDGIWEEIEHIEAQMEIARTFGREWKDKLVAVVGSRCHDWTKAKGGISPQEMAFRENVDEGMPFFSNGGVLNMRVNGIDNDFALLHKSRFHSSLNVTNPNKRVHDLRYPAKFIAIGHHHVASVEDTYRWEGPYQKELALIRTGTYKIDDSWSQSEGFGHGQKGSPMVVMRHDSPDYMVFKKMEHGMMVLKMLRQHPEFWGEFVEADVVRVEPKVA